MVLKRNLAAPRGRAPHHSIAILSEIFIQIGYFLWAPAQRKRATMLYFANVYFYLLGRLPKVDLII